MLLRRLVVWFKVCECLVDDCQVAYIHFDRKKVSQLSFLL